MQARELLGLDIGMKRTGIARASSLAKLAEPLKTVATEEVIEELRRLTAKDNVRTVIIGLPRNLKGEDTAQTDWVRHWLMDAKTELPDIDFLLQDEALTTHAAAEQGGKNITDVDAHAAAIILQDYLDTGMQDEKIV